MIGRIATALASRRRSLCLRMRGMQIDGRARLNRVEIPKGWKNIRLGNEVALDSGVVLLANGAIQIGAHTYINRYTIIDAHESVQIGRGCMIGLHCYITDSNHGTALGTPVAAQPIRSSAVEIGNDVWIGAGVNILAGVTIGTGAVIGAGSVVSRDVAADTVVAGVPAKPLRQRS